jgi:hypothetical protein
VPSKVRAGRKTRQHESVHVLCGSLLSRHVTLALPAEGNRGRQDMIHGNIRALAGVKSKGEPSLAGEGWLGFLENPNW